MNPTKNSDIFKSLAPVIGWCYENIGTICDIIFDVYMYI